MLQLQSFLGGCVYSVRAAANLSKPIDNDLAAWKVWLKKLNLVAISCPDVYQALNNLSLMLADHREYGPILIKKKFRILGEPQFYLYQLNSNVEHRVNIEQLVSITSVFYLVEKVESELARKPKKIASFIFRHVQPLTKQLLLLQILSGGLQSMLFLINFSVLSSIVPDRSIDSWFSVAWLFSAVVLSFFLGQFLIGRVQLMVDSAANEQQKLVQLSVLWSLPPALMNDNTEQQLLLCQKLTNSARSIQKIQQLSVAMLVLVPVLIMMFIRLPIALFVLALLLAVISCFFQVMIEKKKIKKWEAFTQVHSSQRSALRKILSSFKIKRHFVALDSLFDEWLENDMRAIKCRVKVDRLGLLTQQLPDFSSGLVQILSIIGLSFLLVSADSTGSELAIADAFIILHLINTCYQMSPRVAQLFNQLSQVKYDLYSCRKLIAGLRSHKKEPITTPDASVAFHDLKLPYQCVIEQKGLSQISGQQIVHICGESGAGKTTFLHCLLGLQKPVSGKIEVLGVNPHAMDADERCKIFSYVEQKSELLPGSLKDNLNLFASLKVAERDVWHALELVKLDDRVRRLPLGLDTPILDTQASFSTGEQQRIVLAQAILKRSIILVMDEAMSGLPEKMEIEILKNIRPLFQQIFFVSHRAHLQKFADRSIVLSRDVGAV